MFNLAQFLIGLLLAALISGVSWKVRFLSPSGAGAAMLLGTIVFGLGGISWAVLLLGFFISSSLLSRVKRKVKASFDEKYSKGSRRDAGQVLANGGIAGLLVLVQTLLPTAYWVWPAYAGTLAAVNADTWSTELGVLSRSLPRLLTSRKQVERGTSGGVTLEGSLAAMGGAFFIAILAVVFWPDARLGALPGQAIAWVVLFTLAGMAGSFLDSLLGASVQAIYTCPQCQKETERHPTHSCGTPTTLKRGWGWLNNDRVNAACALAGAGVMLVLTLLAPLPLSLGGSVEQSENATTATFTFSSTQFDNGAPIPARFTCDGENLSPALQWSSLPGSTRSLALIVDDPDAPVGTWVHWVMYNIPPTLSGLKEGIAKIPFLENNGTQGINDFRLTGYDGPCPPGGSTHRYFFKVYALDMGGDLPAGLTAAGLRQAIKGHVLAEATWMGTYQRKE